MDRQPSTHSAPPGSLARAVARGKRHRRIVILLRVLIVIGLVGATAMWRRASADVVSTNLTQITEVNPKAVGAGSEVAITTMILARQAPVSDGIIDIELYDANNVKVGQQFFAGQNIGLYRPVIKTFSWPSTASGTYRVAVGVFSSGWSSLLFWASSATTFKVNGNSTNPGSPTSTPVPPTSTSVPPTITSVPVSNTPVPPTSTSVPPTKTQVPPTSTNVPPTSTAVVPTSTSTSTVLHEATSALGSAPANITTTVSATSGSLQNGIIDIEVYDAANQKISQQYFSGQTLLAGQSLTHKMTWTAPTAGTYRVAVGVFGSNWTPTLLWNSQAAALSVSSPTDTPIPTTATTVPSTSTPVQPTATSTSVSATNTPVSSTATSTPATATSTPGFATSGCQLQQVAFCDTFASPAGTGNRSGDLNGTVWGVSRISGNVNLGSPLNGWEPTAMQKCGQNVFVQPPNDVTICNGQLVEAQHDGGTVTALAMYPKQPFDIAGRTGTVVFDVSNNTQGSHAAWPEFWYTDQPIPAPFTHENQTGGSTPRNGFGIRFAGVCGPGQGPNCGTNCPANNASSVVTVDSALVVRNYEPFDTFIGTNGAMKVTALNCVKASSGPGDLNHFELRVSQNEIDVYGTDAGTTSPLKEIATITNANLTLSRGLIWIEDVHYNGNKLNTQGTNTFTWDNVGFDGPVLPRDLAFDVNDSLTPGAALQNGNTGVNLGWTIPTGDPALSLNVPRVSNIAQAAKALLTFNYYSYDMVTLSYQLNNNAWHSLAWPFPDTATYLWRSIAVPISLSELQAGANTLHLKTSGGTTIANVDMVLVGAGGIVAP